MKRLILATSLLFLAACGQPPDIKVDATFTISIADLTNFFTQQCENTLPAGYTQDDVNKCVATNITNILNAIKQSS